MLRKLSSERKIGLQISLLEGHALPSVTVFQITVHLTLKTLSAFSSTKN